MEQDAGSGLTIGEIVRMVVKKIWYVLGATVAVALAAVLIVQFAVNPARRSYSMQFSLVFPTGSEYTYPDGEPFFYQTMISAENLNEAKKGEGLTGIDTDRMIRENRISIYAETAASGGAIGYTGRYTVTAKSAYFSGAEQAEAFIRAIAQAMADRMHTEAGSVDYAVSQETFESAPFEERLNLLAGERETLLNKYDEWISIYDAAYKLKVGETEKSLKEFRASVNAIYGESVQKGLEEELKSGGYYYTDDFQAYTDKLDEEYTRNAAEIEELKKVNGVQYAAISLAVYPQEGEAQINAADPNISQRLAELIRRNNMIAFWRGKNGKKATLTETSNTAFAAKLNEEREKLAGAAEELTAVTKAIYERGMKPQFDMQKVKTEGGVSIALVAVAAAVVAFLVACIAVCVLETGRRKKSAPAAEQENAQQNDEGEDGEKP